MAKWHSVHVSVPKLRSTRSFAPSRSVPSKNVPAPVQPDSPEVTAVPFAKTVAPVQFNSPVADKAAKEPPSVTLRQRS